MIVKSPDPETHIVEDYEFLFSSGQMMPVTIDKTAGDRVSFESLPLAAIVYLAPKPSLTNPSIILPEEEVTIFAAHLLAIQKRTRLVTDLTVEQKEEWNKTLKEFTSVH